MNVRRSSIIHLPCEHSCGQSVDRRSACLWRCRVDLPGVADLRGDVVDAGTGAGVKAAAGVIIRAGPRAQDDAAVTRRGDRARQGRSPESLCGKAASWAYRREVVQNTLRQIAATPESMAEARRGGRRVREAR